nr:hypothetical protein CFP56_13421 [Quercus suber]
MLDVAIEFAATLLCSSIALVMPGTRGTANLVQTISALFAVRLDPWPHRSCRDDQEEVIENPACSSCGFKIPEASPARQVTSPQPTLAPAEMLDTVCSCGKQMFDSRGLCLACLEFQQERQSRPVRRFVLPERAAPSATPPPSQSLYTARSQEHQRRSQSSYTNQPPVGRALDSAFSSQVHASSIFPGSLYHGEPRKASPRASPPTTPGSMYRATSNPPEHAPLPHQIVRQVTPEITPATRTNAASSRSYSPMAAGFARLNRPSETSRRFGSVGERGSLDLEARMFDGPA